MSTVYPQSLLWRMQALSSRYLTAGDDFGESCAQENPSAVDHSLEDAYKVGMEFDICLFFVFFRTLVALNSRRCRSRLPAVIVDVLSSLLLLYSTYNRTLIIRNTDLSQWVSGLCAEGAGALIYNYLVISMVSWIASSVLEFSSSLNLGKVYETKQRRLTSRFSSLNTGRFIVLMAATFCAIISLALTLVLWGFVQRSLGGLAEDATVLVFLTIAALLRLTRQLMEGVTLITGIATREFKWRNPNSQILFGRIAFSSFVLLIHSSSLTYTFATQEKKVWGAAQYTIFMGLCVDIVFRLFACSWATLNSCCLARLARLLVNSHAFFHCATTWFMPVVNVTRRCVRGVKYALAKFVQVFVIIAEFVYLFVYPSVRLVIWRVFHIIFVVLTQMAVAWQTYILHGQDEDEVDENDDPFLEPYLPRQVREETDANHMQEQLVCAPAIPTRYCDQTVCAFCPELAQQHLACIYDSLQYELILPFPPCLCDTELPPVLDPSHTFDPPITGTLFHHYRLQVMCMCVREHIPASIADGVVVTGRLDSSITPTV